MLAAEPCETDGITIAERGEDMLVLRMDLFKSDVGDRHSNIGLYRISQRRDHPAQVWASASGIKADVECPIVFAPQPEISRSFCDQCAHSSQYTFDLGDRRRITPECGHIAGMFLQ